jgi:outer membrane cobalamin receptor
MRKNLSAIVVLFFTTTLMAQTTITGTVSDKGTDEPMPGVNIKVSGMSLGTSADFEGNFRLEVDQTPPFSIELSIVGYATSIVEIIEKGQVVNALLEEFSTFLDEVVVSASRTPERVMESPVTIERMDVRAIKNSSSPTFYDGLENLKGVDINTNSLTNKSVNTRGFATFANTRFMQLVDGMDNSSPALNFALGNLLGMNELDVNTVEVLPGASSALYGANAFNGMLFMTSKNPFNHQGISVYGKTGITSSENAGDNSFVDAGFRVAHAFNEKFAAKVSFSFLNGTEWHATDYRDYNHAASEAGSSTPIVPETGQSSFDRLNVYGDDVSLSALGLNMKQIAQGMEGRGILPPGTSGLIPAVDVSRTGYKEEDLTDYEAQSVKTDISLHYRPNGDDLEIIWNSKFGSGNTIYQGANRYNIKNFSMQQHKFEIRNENFFVRAYTTQEDAGDSYDMRFAGVNISKIGAEEWFGTYVGAYATGAVQILGSGGAPADIVAASAQLHAGARQFADANATIQPGSPEFKAAFEEVTSDPNVLTGAKFTDNTKLYHVDGNYNFGHLLEWAEIQFGGSWRQYSLDSGGTIFTDFDGPIDYDEYGAYMQLQKKFADDRLKFTGSIRYDKAQNFDGNSSPRISFSYSAGEDRNHNFRAAFQTGFRNPTTQDQYIGLDAGPAILIGSALDNLDRYTSKPLNVSLVGQSLGTPAQVTLTGRSAYENSFTVASVFAGAPVKSTFQNVQPERVTAFEAGYRGLLGKVVVDFSAYYNKYEDFIGNKTVLVPLYGQADFSDIVPSPPLPQPTPLALVAMFNGDFQPFQVYTNSEADISSYGTGLGLTTEVFNGYNLGFNYTWSKFEFDQSSDPDYEAGFNTPEHKVKLAFGNPKAFKNFGFNINARWSDEYLWESTFVDAIVDSRTVIDAQVSYSMPKIKSTIKIGGANLGGQEYLSAPGNGLIGSQYFASWTINP